VFVTIAVALAGCGGSSNKEKLPGQRISVLELEKKLTPDPGLAALDVALPQPQPLTAWPEPGGNVSHMVGHPALGDKLTLAWRESIGDGASRYGQVLATPVVENDVIYTIDSHSLVTARKVGDGNKLWEKDVAPQDDDNSQAWGGGIAYAGGRLYVTSGYGHVVALDATTGEEVWRVPLGTPIRAAPTVADSRVFVITVDNQLQVLAAGDGHKLWNYSGIPEAAQLAGAASPAVDGDIVVAPFSSGEIVALKAENGREAWTENLAATRRFDPLSTLADIRGEPVISDGKVYAVSHSGRIAAIDLRTGSRIWEQEIGGRQTPWVVGDYIYVLSSSDELICLTREDGRVRWLTQLDRFEDLEDKSGPIQWSGPILAGDRLIVVASTGDAWSVSPYTGKVLGQFELPAGSFLAPIVADNTLFLTTDDADLMALR
jgi:outer membrane protein assembly factor BamB